METEYLNNFVTLAKIGNYTEAADYLFISQSTLSKRINKLESSLGVALFNRSTKYVELNEFGKIYLKYAQHILSLEEQCLKEIKSKLPSENRKLTIGAIPSMSRYGITELISEFMKSENISVHVMTGQSGKLEKMLLNQECDFAFIRQVHDFNHQFVKQKYTVDRLVALVPKEHYLSEFDSLSISQLKNEPFVLQPENSRPYNYCLSICKQNGFTPNVIFTDSQIDNILEFVSKGMGISLLMKKLVSHLEDNKVQVIEISPPIMTEVTFCYNKSIALNDHQRKFIQFLKKKIKKFETTSKIY